MTDNINISQENVQGNCDFKCAYNFNYTDSNSIAKNNGASINLTYDNTNEQVVLYNNQKYTVNDISIVSPSLHIFNNFNADGEIIIKHTPVLGGENLFVCIPITKSSESSAATTLLSEIVQIVSLNAPSSGETTNLNITGFNLKNIVPNKPFFTYTNNSNVGQGNYIVFNLSNASPLGSGDFLKLNKIITPFPLPTPGQSLFYNSKGPNSTGNAALGEGIYISCQPTGSSEEETTVTYNKQQTSYDLSSMLSGNLQNIIGFIIFVVTIFIINYLYTYFTSNNLSDNISSITKSLPKIVNPTRI
jgi:carbonic anhydrase